MAATSGSGEVQKSGAAARLRALVSGVRAAFSSGANVKNHLGYFKFEWFVIFGCFALMALSRPTFSLLGSFAALVKEKPPGPEALLNLCATLTNLLAMLAIARVDPKKATESTVRCALIAQLAALTFVQGSTWASLHLGELTNLVTSVLIWLISLGYVAARANETRHWKAIAILAFASSLTVAVHTVPHLVSSLGLGQDELQRYLSYAHLLLVPSLFLSVDVILKTRLSLRGQEILADVILLATGFCVFQMSQLETDACGGSGHDIAVARFLAGACAAIFLLANTLWLIRQKVPAAA